jgi:hypothetical protein
MLLPAQCEKVVTISEPMGRPEDGPRVPEGSKTPYLRPNLAGGISAVRVSLSNYARPRAIFRFVISALEAERDCGRAGLRAPYHYLLYKHLLGTPRARFGPNFVTIQPTEVCLCSI